VISRIIAKCQWLTPVTLAPQEAKIRRIEVLSQPGKIVHKTLFQKKKKKKKKPFTKIGLVESLKVMALSSSLSI
jgi:hypothetical protein